jgi:putative tricarboxylic transport membrane protein
MDHYFILALKEVLDFHTLMLIVIGTFIGITSGAIPGFTITMAVLLTFPFTFAMDPINGLALMIGVFVGGFSGGLVSGIMLGIPGTPASITTTYDGYPMHKNGEPGRALGIGVMSSFVGTLVSVLVLVSIGPIVARFALKFGPWEVTALILFALTLVASLSFGAMLKGLIAATIGMLIATVGLSPSGKLRFDFGVDSLAGGFSVLAVMIGLFAFSQLMKNVQELKKHHDTQKRMAEIKGEKIDIPYRIILKDMWKQKWNVLRSSFIGCFVGSLPAAGGDVANFVSYDQARKLSKHPEKFGSGIPDGIVASEASNNATAGGSFIPTLTLGIPGDMTMAIMMGVLILHGLTPGPLLFKTQAVLVGSIYGSLIVASICMLILQLLLIRFFTKIALVPQTVLVPVVIMLCVVGSYSLNNNIFDAWSLFLFGIAGFLLTKCNVPLSPMILGLILGHSFETQLFRALEMNSNLLVFFTRPISAILLLLTLGSIIFSIHQSRKIKRRLNSGQQESSTVV